MSEKLVQSTGNGLHSSIPKLNVAVIGAGLVSHIKFHKGFVYSACSYEGKIYNPWKTRAF